MGALRAPHLGILHGWKEIANFLRRGVRTVQRYERDLGLPVHRLSGKSRGSVLAEEAELRQWIANTAHVREMSNVHEAFGKIHRIGADFLRVNCEAALTFARLALETPDKNIQRRRAQIARRAYDNIRRIEPNIKQTDAERKDLDSKLRQLKRDLEELGGGLSRILYS